MQHQYTRSVTNGKALFLAISLSLLAGCGQEAGQEVSGNREQLARGYTLYQTHCARCHGSDAQGAVNWQRRNSDGSFPPPPLNGTGHAWHHPKAWLFAKIKYGGAVGQGVMPPWNDKLSDAEIEALIAWFQSRWPEEIYAAWQRRSAP